MPINDEWRAIEADPVYKGAPKGTQRLMRRIYDKAATEKAGRPPLVTPQAADPSPAQRRLNQQAEAKQARRIGTSAPLPTMETVGRSAIEGAREAGNLTADLLLSPNREALARHEATKTPMRRAGAMSPAARAIPANQPPRDGFLDPFKATAEALRQEPGRLAPWSDGAGQGAGAAVGAVGASLVDPVVDVPLGLAGHGLKVAARGLMAGAPAPAGPPVTLPRPLPFDPVRHGDGLYNLSKMRPDVAPTSAEGAETIMAARRGLVDASARYHDRGGARSLGRGDIPAIPAGRMPDEVGPPASAAHIAEVLERTKRTATPRPMADIIEPRGWRDAAKRIIEDEAGTFDPMAFAAGVGRLADRADDAFEAAGQAVGRAAETVGMFGKAALDSGAERIADPGQRLGDALHVPKQAAENAASAIARQVDLPGRTGRTAAEWLEAIKHHDATTPFATLNKALNEARRWTISDYGMSPEMKAIREDARVFGNNAARPLEDLAVRLNNERTGAEQFDIQWRATEQTPPPGPYNAQSALDAIDVQRVSREADRTLEGVGALPPGLAQEYDGRHLPRAYAKHWGQEAKPSLFKASPENKMGGYYRRGLDETMSENELLARQASAAQTGEDWKLVRRHADGRTVDAHRDWTIEERMNWGEIRHAASALQRKAVKVNKDARAGRLFQSYAQPGAGDHRGQFAYPASQFQQAGAPAGALPTERTINGQRYVLLDSKKAKESSVPKWGALANHYVRDDVAFHLWNQNDLKRWVDNFNEKSLNNLWKKMVTIGNFPGYFVNNFFQNPLILERSGGTMADMPAAWASLARNSVDVQRLEDAGVIRNGVLARELGAQMEQFNKTLSSHNMHTGFTISKQVWRAMNALKKYEQNGYKLAGASDDLYRVALVEGLMRREGKTFEEAAEIAKKAFYDSDAVTAPLAQLATTISPFAKVFWWAADNEVNAWVKNPGKTAYINALVSALPVAFGWAMGKNWQQQDAEELAKYPHMRGHGNSFPLPYTDSEGQPYYLDTSAWNLYNQFKSIDNTALPYWPRGLSPGGPLAIGAQMWLGKDAFTGKNLVKLDANDQVIEDLRPDFLRRNVLPGAARNGSALYGAATGATTPLGNRVSLPAQLARMAGIKANPVNVPRAVERTENRKAADTRDYTTEINRRQRLIVQAYRDGNEAAIPQLEAEIELLIQKRSQMQQAADEKMQRMEAR